MVRKGSTGTARVRRVVQGWSIFKRIEDDHRDYFPKAYEYDAWDGPFTTRAEAEACFRQDRGTDSYWYDEPGTKSPTFVVGKIVVEIPAESKAIQKLRAESKGRKPTRVRTPAKPRLKRDR